MRDAVTSCNHERTKRSSADCLLSTEDCWFENVIQVNEGSAYHSILHYSSEFGHLKLYNYNKMVAGTDQRK